MKKSATLIFGQNIVGIRWKKCQHFTLYGMLHWRFRISWKWRGDYGERRSKYVRPYGLTQLHKSRTISESRASSGLLQYYEMIRIATNSFLERINWKARASMQRLPNNLYILNRSQHNCVMLNCLFLTSCKECNDTKTITAVRFKTMRRWRWRRTQTV